MAKSGVTVTKDTVDLMMKQIRALVKTEVLIGVPDETAARSPAPGEEQSPISNAGIGYAMEFGLPEKNVPARPFLVPGVSNAKDALGKILENGVLKALKGDKEATSQALEKAGSAAVISVKNKIIDGPFVPLSPRTVAQRAAQRGSKSQRKSEKLYLDQVASGIDPAIAQASAGIKPLINTGALRDSVIYVIRPKGE